MMPLSPKAIRFLIDAITHYQAYHEECLRDARLTEEETADLTNDQHYLAALKTDLQKYHAELVRQGSSPTKVR